MKSTSVISSKFKLNANTKHCFRANVCGKNEMKLISLLLWSSLMTDDFKALVFKTGKGKPKCLEVLCSTNATSTNTEMNPGLRSEKSDNNHLSTNNDWLCGIRGKFEIGMSNNKYSFFNFFYFYVYITTKLHLNPLN